MEPVVQYARTTDGVSIAYWTLGEGPALVYGPFFFSHIGLEWAYPETRAWYERLAQRHTLVRYDWRGMGLSEPTLAFSLESSVLDIEAVVDRLGLDTFSLLGLFHSCPPAISYAARHPEKVSRLLLWSGYARAEECLRSPQIRAVRGMLDTDWEMYTETAAHVLYGWSEGEPGRRFAALIRAAATPQYITAVISQLSTWDVADLLPQVRTPALILHRREMRLLDVSSARGLAARIPDARLALLEGTLPVPYLGDVDAVLHAIESFLDAGSGDPRPTARGETSAFRTILFTDIAGHTPMMQRLGDDAGRAVLREHERITRDVLRQHAGAEVKTDGDSFMASFTSATKAVECAVALQRAFAEWNESERARQAAPLHVRMGLNAGEPIAEAGADGRADYFGTAVILASRIAAEAAGGEIFASVAVRELCAGKNILFADRGETALRGFDDPVRIYEVRWREA